MKTDRTVTEDDLRKPEFRGKEVEDYEFRSDGEVVRKDRWEKGIRAIVGELSELDWAGFSDRKFEIDDVVRVVAVLVNGHREKKEI